MIRQENPYRIYEIDKELEALKGRSNTELIRMYNAGHPRAFTGLIYKNEGIIHLVINRTRGKHKKSFADIAEASADSSLEDLEQIGYITLYSAIGTYDPDKGATFLTWLANNLEWDIMKYFRSIKMDEAIRQISLNELVFNSEDFETELGELIASEDNAELEAIDNMFAYELGRLYDRVFKKALSSVEENIIRLQYGITKTKEAYTLDEISEAIEVDAQEVRDLRQSALGKLRNKYTIRKIYYESKPKTESVYRDYMKAAK